MPLRSTPSPLALRLLRQFHSSAARRVESQNHYDILQIPTNATPAEVKKSFYSLSKTHHPDRNPSDPKASERFVQISEAYHVLGIPAKRRDYDRIHVHKPSTPIYQQTSIPQGSYSSTQYPAGGRPASGLSRRRTQFRGPPPSFYRNGGWGHHSEKRRAAQENGAPAAEAPSYDESIPGSRGGLGYGQSQFVRPDDIAHFDKESHARTHSNHDRRGKVRRSERSNWDEVPEELPGMFTKFWIVSGVLGIGLVGGTLLQAFRKPRSRP